MCGIVGYIGKRKASPILINGLHRLEYRGYDSAGVAFIEKSLKVSKCKGKVSELESLLKENESKATLGIGHTRWATHGIPNDVNAHPHFSEREDVALVHNGIIENHDSLRKELKNRGRKFRSDTDTEVLVHLIEEIKQKEGKNLLESVQSALTQVVGAYAIAVVSKHNPDELVVAKKGSPLVIGIGDGEFFVASDASAIVEHTKDVVYLNDGEVASVSKENGLLIKTIDNQEKTPYIQTLELSFEELEKGEFEHFMLKEIFEQPKSIKDSMRGRLNLKDKEIILGGIADYEEKILNAKRIIFVSCGTSWHAGLIGEYLIEDLARIPVEVEYASEFRYRNPVLSSDDIVIAISQSGETADTIAALELAKSKGATTMGICNVVGSSIARMTDAGLYIHAGPEIGVASTKAFTSQVTVLTLMALWIAKKKNSINEEEFNKLIEELGSVPEKVQSLLDKNSRIKAISEKYKSSTNALFLGRGYGFPTALEGALKLKEISYIHAEGYPAAEMKHGPIALIDENMPVFVVSPQGSSYEKVLSNIQEIKARNGKVIAIATEGDEIIENLADELIEIPKISEPLIPLLSVIPLQLISYYIAVMRGCNVDQPRNLAKSVTVE